MTDLSPRQLVSVAVHGVAAVVWAGVALREWQQAGPRPRGTGAIFPLLRNLTTFGALFYACQTALRLVPPEVAARPPGWLVILWVAAEWALALTVVTARHLTRYWGVRFEPPSRAWLARNRGAAAAMMALTVAVPVLGLPMGRYLLVRSALVVGLFVLAVVDMAGVARRGLWRPGAAANVIRAADVAIFAGGITAMVVGIVMLAGGHGVGGSSWHGVAIDAAIALCLTVPLAVRELHAALRSLALAAGTVTLAAVLLLGGRTVLAPVGAAGAPQLADLVLVLTVAGGVALAATRLGPFVDRVLFGRRQHLWEELQQFLATLAPEDGVVPCCRRALAEVVRGLGLRGAAIVLRDGEAISEGAFDVGPLARLWPRGEALDAVPAVFVNPEQLVVLPPPVIEALIGAEVVGIVSIASPRKRWGTLFGTSGLIEPTPEDAPAVDAFTAQLALVLDAAALIERTVAVERSLAHAEKLAAIGEVAARIAHEIRNPVTAARSLAQLLGRDPTAPENVESVALILSELERVERHVRDLLRFARREEYAAEPLDLGALARGACEPFAPRFTEAAVALAVETEPDVVIQGDREKLRQVLVNLLENALDALAGVPAGRRIAVAVTRANGRATVRVSDTGPGIPPDVLARVFEPFFSTKTNGTGLGLAIVRRIVAAHGGRITAEPDVPRGTTFRIELPA